ncbi:hypothetical protein [Arcobacter sp. F2176]|uniref:hypothetical protein n=1 Tax=unclassified Arcobacter TaxID=2593671 RepID=UPI00100AD8D7|nr:hypothetical protein [Arcobacter sp. F2176]RXJ80850.1 hypothetical protein CRU95_09450 [Arcobacter sp. F2176]
MLDKILNFCFSVSKQPVLLKDLLVANVQHNEKMHVDAAKLGFRLSIGKAYIVYIMIVCIPVIPLSLLAHAIFAKIDAHASIVVSIIFTAIIFIWFNFFRIWIKDKMANRVIRKAWMIHFPYFPYDEYRYKIEEIFHKAMKNEIPRKDLERYILDSLVQN